MRYTHTLLSLHWAPTSHWCQTWPQVPIISWALLGTNRKVGIWLSAHPISATKSHLKLQQQLQGSHSSQAVSCVCWEQSLHSELPTALVPLQHSAAAHTMSSLLLSLQGRPKLGSDAAGFVSAAKANGTNEQQAEWGQSKTAAYMWVLKCYPAASPVIHVPHFSHKVLLQYKGGKT